MRAVLEKNISKRKINQTYEAFINQSTMGAARPAGLIAGARAMKTLTFSFSSGCILRAAKACAVPWLKPM